MRDFQGNPKFVTKEVNPDAQWVFDGEGVATRKYDGSCCAIIDGKFYKRYEVRKNKVAPQGFIPANEVDLNTGKQQGWLEVGKGNEDKYHREAFERLEDRTDGTFELLGPKVQGNPEGFSEHTLLRHSKADVLREVPRTWEGIKNYLKNKDIEGVVWHHPNGPMAKIKKRDFDYKEGTL